MTTSRGRKRPTVPASQGVRAVVRAGYLVAPEGVQVGAGTEVLLHPDLAIRWARNGWVDIVSEDATD